jgi:hypothetical protein
MLINAANRSSSNYLYNLNLRLICFLLDFFKRIFLLFNNTGFFTAFELCIKKIPNNRYQLFHAKYESVKQFREEFVLKRIKSSSV